MKKILYRYTKILRILQKSTNYLFYFIDKILKNMLINVQMNLFEQLENEDLAYISNSINYFS